MGKIWIIKICVSIFDKKYYELDKIYGNKEKNEIKSIILVKVVLD